MCENHEDVITVGMHVIIKKQDYSKVYKVSASGTTMLGKDKVKMDEIIGKPFWTTFEMVPLNKEKNTFSLKMAPEAESWHDLKNSLPSGSDNRSITDDGTSQKLTKEEILQLQESGMSGKEIIGSLIENSASFVAKTEYSQEKYIKKKERKYFKYLTICKTTIVSLQEVYFRLDHCKIGGLRMDALSQLLSYSDVQSEGLYILYDSGSQGLPAAAIMNRIGAGTKGSLINLFPGNVAQTTIVQAMNFPTEQTDRMFMANIYSFLRLYYQGESSVLNHISVGKKSARALSIPPKGRENQETTDSNVNPQDSDDVTMTNKNDEETKSDHNMVCNNGSSAEICTPKRKIDDTTEAVPPKKPRWLTETQGAVDLIKDTKARGLAIVAKEHPLNILESLLPFLGLSRPFVVFHMHREPLQETYMALKLRQGVINLRLFSNFLRSYQVLPDRTRPEILTSDTGGYLLTGYLVER